MRRTPLRPSAGTVWPREEAQAIHARDLDCVGPRVGMPGVCDGPPEKDHVRASHGVSMKSESTRFNGVLLCAFVHHPMKTREGRTWRPVLLAYLTEHYGIAVSEVLP